jgi:hypothetical protein
MVSKIADSDNTPGNGNDLKTTLCWGGKRGNFFIDDYNAWCVAITCCRVPWAVLLAFRLQVSGGKAYTFNTYVPLSVISAFRS